MDKLKSSTQRTIVEKQTTAHEIIVIERSRVHEDNNAMKTKRKSETSYMTLEIHI